MLARFARLMVRRRRLVVAGWAVALVAVTLASTAWGGDHRADYTMPGSDSARAQELFAEQLPEQSGDTVQLVVSAAGGVDAPDAAERLAALADEARAVAHVTDVRTTAVSPGGTVALVTAQLDRTAEKVPTSTIEALVDVAADATADAPQDGADAFTVEAGGPAVQTVEQGEAGSEGIGMLAALVILLVAFGSVLAAGLPLVVALFGLGVALAVGSLANHVVMVPEWAPTLVTMIGLGVGIDYALFIVTRYRSALAAGEDPEAAVVTAQTTAGRAVLFAGGTVVISLVGLAAMGLEYLYGTAVVTVTGVLVVLVAAMTLLPALLGFAGRTIDRFRLPFVRGDRGEDGLWARWSHVVQKRPLVTGTVALVALVLLALPAANLRFGYPDAGTSPADMTSRRAYDTVAEAFGPGANGPLVLAVELPGDDAADRVVLDDLAATVAAAEGVAAVLPPAVSASGEAAAVLAVPTTGPQDEATEQLIHRLRDDVVPAALAGTPDGTEVHVGGAVAAFVDESEYMGGRLPVFIGAVIALSFVLLLVVFRSLLVAVKAALMNVLAIGAAYGVMAMALEGGWLGQLLGIEESTPVPVWLPMMMFALLFGLSMDYEVFLLSRIREEYLRTRDNASAVAHGMARTGRVISAAAAIMVTVFAAFILGDQVLIKVTGLGLAVAVLLDATIVRMVLVPSTMELLGDRNWWLPGWLDRLLPHLDIEGDTPAGSEGSSASAGDGDAGGRDGAGSSAGAGDADHDPERVLVG
jgi:RND superfamily putative drug exporter